MLSISPPRLSTPRRLSSGADDLMDVEHLGERMAALFPRRIFVVYARIREYSLSEEILTPEELAMKMDEVKTRWACDLVNSAPATNSKGHT